MLHYGPMIGKGYKGIAKTDPDKKGRIPSKKKITN